MPDRQHIVLDARAMDRTLRRMADEIVELNEGTDDLIIVGIQRRGVQLAARIVSSIRDREHVEVPSGALDITLYRDDLQTVGPRPVVGPTDLPWAIDGKHVVIVDDVLYVIHSYGVPIYVPGSSSFNPVAEALVSVLAYRREDATQAAQTIAHLTSMLETGGFAKKVAPTGGSS